MAIKRRGIRNYKLSRRLLVPYTCFLLVFFIIWSCYKLSIRSLPFETSAAGHALISNNSLSSDHPSEDYLAESFSNSEPKSILAVNDLIHFKSNESIPTIARVLYLFLCENQIEVNIYSKVFPSVTADVMFFCWRTKCNDLKFLKLERLHVAPWFGSTSRQQRFVRSNPAVNYTMIEPRVFITNEKELNLSTRTTWTTARNLLLERALTEERRQGWRWAYFNFADGDIQFRCPYAENLLQTNLTVGDEIIFADHFRSLSNNRIKTAQCLALIDTFLLTVSPAIGVFEGIGTLQICEGLLGQVVYHVDAMFNAFHRDVIPFVLPYCPRYDARSWWTSQAILIYRSLCVYGHVIQFNGVYISQKRHREYPRNGDPWMIHPDMNLVPPSLIPLQKLMNQSRLVSALVLRHYSGWSLQVANNECRQQHTFVDPLTCRVGRSGK